MSSGCPEVREPGAGSGESCSSPRGPLLTPGARAALALPALVFGLMALAGDLPVRIAHAAEARAAGHGGGTPSPFPVPRSPLPVLRVCADPNNLPFSNARGEGFENRLAELVARDMGKRVRYTWWAQRRGFIRNTLKAGECDVVMGVPSSMEMVLATRPYYRSTYVFVQPASAPAKVRSFDDTALLKRLRVGVQMIGDDYANSPPAHALAARGVTGLVGYSVYGDYREESPPSRIVRAVAGGEVDVAVVWGPLAGYWARRQRVPLALTPVSPQVDPPYLPFVFDIAMGVRRTDAALRDSLDRILVRRRPEIERLLDSYGVPRVGTRVHRVASRPDATDAAGAAHCAGDC